MLYFFRHLGSIHAGRDYLQCLGSRQKCEKTNYDVTFLTCICEWCFLQNLVTTIGFRRVGIIDCDLGSISVVLYDSCKP